MSFIRNFAMKRIVSSPKLALFHLLVTTTLYAYWFKSTQLAFVSEQIVPLYPMEHWAHHWLICFLFFLALILLWGILRLQCDRDGKPSRILLEESLLLFPFMLPLMGWELSAAIRLYIGLKLVQWAVLLIVHWQRIKQSPFLRHLKVLLFFLGVSCFFLRFISPFSWKKAATVSYDGSEVGLEGLGNVLYRSLYLNAKVLDFSGFSDTCWGSISHSVRTLYSIVLPWLTILFDLPIVDSIAFIQLHHAMLYFWCLAGMFGFYLYCLYGLQLGASVSIYGGVAYLVSNLAFHLALTKVFSLVCGVYLMLPFCLLTIHIAFRENRASMAFWSGVLLVLPLYYLAPHPDVYVHGCVFLGMVQIGFSLLYRSSSIIKIWAWFVVGALGVSAWFWMPIVESIWMQEFGIFGRHPAVSSRFIGIGEQLVLLYRVLQNWGFLIVALGVGCLFARQSGLAHIFIAIFVIYIVFFLFAPQTRVMHWVATVVPGFNFHFLPRIWVYLALSSLILALFGLQYLKCPENRTKLWLCLGLFLLISGGLLGTISGLGYSSSLPPEAKNWWKYVSIAVSIGVVFCIVRYNNLMLLALLLFLYSWCYYLESRMAPVGRKPPYIALQTLVNNYRFLGYEDKASMKFIKSRLCNFDKSKFCHIDESEVLDVAKSAAREIDEHYLRESEWYPESYVRANHREHHQIADFNNVNVLENVPSRLARVLPITDTYECESFFGVAPGLLLVNGTWEVDVRWMSAYPPINALYIHPYYYYESAGFENGLYSKPGIWFYTLEEALDPRHRKIRNIAGVQYYVLLDDPQLVPDLSQEWKEIPYYQHQRLKPPFRAYKDERSYHLAYFASRIEYVAPEFGTKKMVPLFLTGRQQSSYREKVDKLWRKLNSLNKKHSILLESKVAGQIGKKFDLEEQRNRIHEFNYIGRRAVFNVSCAAPPCQLVFNNASIGGWRAFVNEIPTRIDRANYAFLSVRVPEGDHVVWFEHRRLFEQIGIIVTLLLLAGGLLERFRSMALCKNRGIFGSS